MNILGIDYGLKKVGIALAVGMLAEPYVVLKFTDPISLISQISHICLKEKVEKIVIGISEGETARKTKEFSQSLSKSLNLPVEEYDETLSTQDAQRLGMEAHMKRSKRKRIEDAMAAAVMLQNYIDSHTR